MQSSSESIQAKQNAKHISLSNKGDKTLPDRCFPLLQAKPQTFPHPRG